MTARIPILLSLALFAGALAACAQRVARPTAAPAAPRAAATRPAPRHAAVLTAADWYALGVTAMTEKRYADAVTTLGQCVRLTPVNPRCQWELGWTYYMLGQWNASLLAWDEVARLDPAFPGVPKARGNALLHQEAATQMAAVRSTAPRSFAPKKKLPLLRIRAVGDTMLGSDYPAPRLPPAGVSPFQDVASLLQDADMTFANLEGALCSGGVTLKCAPGETCFAFRTPLKYATYYRDAGIDLVSMANNHSYDFGEACNLAARDELKRLGIEGSGSAGSVTYLRRRQTTIAMIAFHASELTNDMRDIEAAAAIVGRIANDNDVTIVSFHGGAEGINALHTPDGVSETYLGEDRGNVVRFARRMVDVGADLVLGHGPHVPRAMEIRNGRLIAYSLGNFATYGSFNLSGFNGFGLVLEVQLDRKGRFATGKIYPTRQLGEGIPAVDPSATAVDLVRMLSEADFPETGVRVAQDGSLAMRPAPPPVKKPGRRGKATRPVISTRN